MEELFDSEIFLAHLPVFTIVRKADFHKFGLIQSIPKTIAEPHGTFLPLFTDTDLADRFRASLYGGRAKAHPMVSLNSLNALGQVVAALQQVGCKYVGIDVTLGQNPRGQFVPIDSFLADLRKNGFER